MISIVPLFFFLSAWLTQVQTGKAIAITGKAIRETCVFRHHVSPIEGFSENPLTSRQRSTEGFKGALN